MNRRKVLGMLGAGLFLSSGVLWILLFAGVFRQETERTTGRIVHHDPGESHYKFLFQNRVYEGRLEGNVDTGTELTVFYQPGDPSVSYAVRDGDSPSVTMDSGFALPSVVAVFLLAIGLGCFVGIQLLPRKSP